MAELRTLQNSNEITEIIQSDDEFAAKDLLSQAYFNHRSGYTGHNHPNLVQRYLYFPELGKHPGEEAMVLGLTWIHQDDLPPGIHEIYFNPLSNSAGSTPTAILFESRGMVPHARDTGWFEVETPPVDILIIAKYSDIDIGDYLTVHTKKYLDDSGTMLLDLGVLSQTEIEPTSINL